MSFVFDGPHLWSFNERDPTQSLISKRTLPQKSPRELVPITKVDQAITGASAPAPTPSEMALHCPARRVTLNQGVTLRRREAALFNPALV